MSTRENIRLITRTSFKAKNIKWFIVVLLFIDKHYVGKMCPEFDFVACLSKLYICLFIACQIILCTYLVISCAIVFIKFNRKMALFSFITNSCQLNFTL